MSVATKICKTCGRQISTFFRTLRPVQASWRAKWARNWDSISYCSDSCRSNKKLSPFDRALEQSMLASLTASSNAGSDGGKGLAAAVVVDKRKGNVVRVSDVEKAVVETFSQDAEPAGDKSRPDDQEAANEGEGRQTGQATKMIKESRERARRAARRLVDAGQVEIVQNGKVVDPSFAKGEIDVRLKTD